MIMTFHEIRKKILSLEKYFLAKADAGPRPDTPARAVVERGLRCRVHSPDGKSIFTDMSASLGGSATANSPGWLSRAAIASCDATLLAIRAAYQGIELDSIEVNVYASSDGRGMILDEGILPGSSEIRVLFNIGTRKASAEQVRELVDWVVTHSPVGSDISRTVDLRVEIAGTEKEFRSGHHGVSVDRCGQLAVDI
jgi:uncharacterized OsmC-like protein